MDIAAVFEKYHDEYIKFERIVTPRHRRPDLCAFLMLDEVIEQRNAIGGFSDMVAGAEHDEISLEISPDLLASVATDDLICDLVRCGVRYDDESDCLVMFT